MPAFPGGHDSTPRRDMDKDLRDVPPEVANAGAHERRLRFPRPGRPREAPMFQGVSIAAGRADPWVPDIVRPQHLDR